MDRRSNQIPVQVSEVRTRRDERDFLRVPFELYAADGNWVPPLLREEKRQWRARHNSTLIGRPHWRFLARAGERVVGRIVASLDPGFARRWRPASGFFGFFECVDDAAVAGALLEAAERRLANEGVATIVGPVNLSTQNEIGLLTDGFDRPPRILSPYNRPYYAELLCASGFRPLRTYHAYLWRPDCEPLESARRLAAAIRRRAARIGLVVRSPDVADWTGEARRLHSLYNQAFDRVFGFTPISWPEFEERASRFRSFLDPQLVVLVELHGALVGFGLVLPDINVVLKKMNGRWFPFGWLAALRSAARIDRARFVLLAVHPDQFGMGLGVLIASEMAQRGRDAGIRDAELSLVDTENADTVRVIRSSGCRRVRTFTLYSKPI